MSLKRFARKIDQQVKQDLKNYFRNRDYMVIAVAEKEPVRVYVVRATETVRKAQMIHGLSPILAVIAGRVLCGALLLSSMVKHATSQKLVLKIETDGPVKSVVAEVDGYGHARCMINTSQVEQVTKVVDGRKKFDLGSILKNGRLVVIKDVGLKEPYMGIVPLVSGEIAQDIAYYLWKSEQIPSAVALGVLIGEDGVVKQAGGYLVQPLGGTSPEVLEEIEKRIKDLPPVSQLMEENKRPEDIASIVLEGMNPHLLGLKEVSYYCPCNKDIVGKLIAGLPKEEMDLIFSKHPTLEVSCNYCGKVYHFTREEVERIIDEATSGQDNT